MTIDLIIPVLNPGIGWADRTLSMRSSIESLVNRSVRLIISDDGSTNTREFDRFEKAERVLVTRSARNRGKGHALRQGMAMADADIILFTDADFPYDNDSIQRIISCIESGNDIALGFRERDYYASVPWFRQWLSESFRFILRRMLHFPITDTQCGIKAVNRRGRDVFMQTRINRFLVDMEFIKLATRSSNLKIVPVKVQLRQGVVFSKMGMRILLPEVINFIRVLFR